MRERAVQFGKDPVHTGILCEPDVPPEAGRPTCLLLNAGVIHRVGPNRLYVNVARTLAASGYASLRFDMSGRGDTDVRRDGETFIASGVKETRTAMDYLQQLRGTERFVPMGICSGAHDAVRTAMVDERIVGAVLIETYVYPTFEYRVRHLARRVASWKKWRDTLTGRTSLGQRLLRGVGVDPGGNGDLEGDDLSNAVEGFIPPKHEIEGWLRSLADRGTELCFIFAGSTGIYNYRRQLFDAYRSLTGHPQIRIEYFPGADHTFTRLHYQQCLLSTITQFMPVTDRSTPGVRA